jgi:DNA-binding GntR family transcriptional regulator
VSRAQLSDEAATYVRELIMSGQLRASEFVRIEKVAEDLGISVTPVREGLLALRGEGFLHLEPRRGFMVAPLTGDDVQDLFWVQAQLAGELASRAAERISEDGIAALERLQDDLDRALSEGDLAAVEEYNHQFHRLMNLAADAPKLAWFLGLSVRYVPRRFYDRIGGWPDASLHDHVPVLEALKTRAPEAARTAMQEHILHIGLLLGTHVDLTAVEELEDEPRAEGVPEARRHQQVGVDRAGPYRAGP